ncbi:MAG: hypothetical protein R2772_03225 [Chitinophagales bacterium]
MKKILGLFFLFSMAFGLKAQEASVIQFSGYVLTPDTLLGIPFVVLFISTIRIEETISNVDGFFLLLLLRCGDTINFS